MATYPYAQPPALTAWAVVQVVLPAAVFPRDLVHTDNQVDQVHSAPKLTIDQAPPDQPLIWATTVPVVRTNSKKPTTSASPVDPLRSKAPSPTSASSLPSNPASTPAPPQPNPARNPEYLPVPTTAPAQQDPVLVPAQASPPPPRDQHLRAAPLHTTPIRRHQSPGNRRRRNRDQVRLRRWLPQRNHSRRVNLRRRNPRLRWRRLGRARRRSMRWGLDRRRRIVIV